jgi:hypothetical protein
MNKVTRMMAIIVFSLMISLPVVAQARGCKSCGGSYIVQFVPLKPHEFVMLNDAGYAVGMQMPAGFGLSIIHFCLCEDADYCEVDDIKTWAYGPGLDLLAFDQLTPACIWAKDTNGIWWCGDVACSPDNPKPPIRLVRRFFGDPIQLW